MEAIIAKSTEKIEELKTNMKLIPAGKFLMGAEGWGEFESPVHEVFIDAFLMDATPVTNSDFAGFIEKTNYRTSAEIEGLSIGYESGKMQKIVGLNWKSYFNEERKNHPVVLVSWQDANEFAKWAGKRLPTEAEWEKASRGNLDQNLYPWGNQEPDQTICNFSKKTFNFPSTTEVKSFPPNDYGLYDMAGNVWNWCSDWYSEDYYAFPEFHNPQGPLVGTTKIRRGAAFNIIQAFRLRCANRGIYWPDKYAINTGFRCVKDLNNE